MLKNNIFNMISIILNACFDVLDKIQVNSME